MKDNHAPAAPKDMKDNPEMKLPKGWMSVDEEYKSEELPPGHKNQFGVNIDDVLPGAIVKVKVEAGYPFGGPGTPRASSAMEVEGVVDYVKPDYMLVKIVETDRRKFGARRTHNLDKITEIVKKSPPGHVPQRYSF